MSNDSVGRQWQFNQLSAFLAGAMLSLVLSITGFWLTHGVTHEELKAAQESQDAVINTRLTRVEQQFDKLDMLRDDMVQVKMALGISGDRKK